MNASKNSIRYPRLHRDGTVSFWSYHQQDWVEHAFHVPIEDLQAMEPYDRKRVRRHLGYETAEALEPVEKVG